MNTDKAKGKANDVAGRIQRKVGELTGSKKTQVRGAARQVKGKAQQVKGALKDSLQKASKRDRSDASSATGARVTTRTTRTTTIRRTRPA